MLPKFEIKERDGRFYVETDWCIPSEVFPRVTDCLQVTTAGKLDTASVGWATRDKAEKAMEQCKARLR